MKLKTLVVWGTLPFFLAVLIVGKQIVRNMPPYEMGIHNQMVEAQSNGSSGNVPRIGKCQVFPKDNVWNTPVDKLDKDQRSDAYIESIGAAKKVHPDFGSNLTNGIPFTEIPPGTRRSRVAFSYKDDSDLGNYPIPDNPPIEGGAGATGDRHIIFVDSQRCILYELFAAKQVGEGEWKAGSGVKFDLTGNALRAAGKSSTDAAGLPILPGLVRYEEVADGEINHALRFTVPHTQAAFMWPARHKASKETDPNTPPMGLRLRLKADFDISKYPKQDQVIMKALKRYGMFLADNGGAMFISGVPDKRWSDDDLHKLGGMTAGDFEAVDESGWQILADSARVDPLAKR